MPFDAKQVFQFSGDLRKSRNRIGKQVADVVRDQARQVEATAKRLAPVRTGGLRNSIHMTTSGSGSSSSIAASVSADAYYSRFLENGTARMAPQPFMGPALDAQEDEFYTAVEKAAEETLGGT